mgnify:FL=1
MCSYYSSDSSLVAIIVVVIAIWSFTIQVALVEQRNSVLVSMFDLQQQGGLGG